MIEKIKEISKKINLKEHKEIIIATLFFIICPILSLPIQLYFLFKSEKYRKIYTFYISVIIGIIYMNATPTKNFDLYRYYIKMNALQNFNFNEMLTFIKENSEPLMNIIFYIFANITYRKYIILFTSVIFYNLYFYMFFDYADKLKLNKKIVNFLIISFMIANSITETIICIRFSLAAIFLMFAIYVDMVKNKKQWYYKLLYVIPLLIHNSMFIFLAVRMLMVFNKEKLNKYILTLLIVASLCPSIIILILKHLPKIPVFVGLMNRLGYLTANVDFNNYKLLTTAINIAVSILLVDIYRKNPKNKITQLCILYFIPAICLIFGVTITERLYVILIMIMTFPVMEYYKKIGPKYINKSNFIIYFSFFGCLIFKFRSQIIMLNNCNALEPIMNNMIKNIVSIIIN